MEHQRGLERTDGRGRPAPSTASTVRSSMSRRGIRGRPTWAGARSTFATRCWARSRRWAAKATCRCIPLLAGSPAVDAAVGDAGRDQQRDAWIDDIDTGPARPLDAVRSARRRRRRRHGGARPRRHRAQRPLADGAARRARAGSLARTPSSRSRADRTAAPARPTPPRAPTNEFVTYALPDRGAGPLRPERRRAQGRRRREVPGRDRGRSRRPVDRRSGPSRTATRRRRRSSRSGRSRRSSRRPARSWCGFSVTGKNPASAGFTAVSRLHRGEEDARARVRSRTSPPAEITPARSCPGAASAAGAATRAASSATAAGADRGSPPVVDALSGVTAVAAGVAHTCALSTDGSVRCWGSRRQRPARRRDDHDAHEPPADPVLSGVKAIAAGRAHTCALTTSGGVRCWGANDSGQLGDGSTTNRMRPPTTDVLSGVKAVAAGGAHTCALMTDGGVRCWGANSSGQLGDGSTADQRDAARVGRRGRHRRRERGRQSHLRAHQRGRRPLLGTQHRRRARHRQLRSGLRRRPARTC